VKRAVSDATDFELVHADLLRFFPQLVRELGGDPQAMLYRLGIQPSEAAQEPPSLNYRSWVKLLEHAASALHCPDFGMRLARLQAGGRVLGPISAVMRNSHTFGEAIDYVARHFHAHSLAAGMRLEWDRGDDSLFVGHEILLDRLPNRRQAIEQMLVLAHLNAVDITRGQARVREVRFRHQALSPASTYRAYFGSAVRFDAQEDGVVFSARDLRAPIIERDARQYALATSFIDTRFGRVTPPMHTRVRALLVRLIETEDCSITRICDRLRLHPRTLHRRLRAEGKSFERIKDEVRRDIALRCIQETDHSLTVVAEKLGYAEQSVLTRSCVRWFAASPSQLRSQGAP
jgi:AraC-like DNA-binding protein